MQLAYYAHFVSADGELLTPIGKISSDLGKIDPDKIKKKSLNIGQIAITPYGKKKIFSIVIKSRHFDKTNTQDIFIGLNNLKDTLVRESITSFRVSRTGDARDDLAPNEFIKNINDLFSNTEIIVTICYGKIRIPKDKDRLGIHRLGGHRGVTKLIEKFAKDSIGHYFATMSKISSGVVKVVRSKTSCELKHASLC